MNRGRPRIAAVLLAVSGLLAGALLAGCGSSHYIGTTDTPQPGDSVAYPVTVTSCGVSVTYNQAPKRAVLAESCAHVSPGTTTVSIDDTYQDLRNLGEIFNVRTRAAKVIAGMQAQVAQARAKIAGTKPVTVFDYDSGQSAPFTGPGLAMPTALITLGGGTNIFGSLKQSWTSVSWEQVVKAQPRCIIINDYGTPTAAQKEKFLETSPVTRNLPAVKNHCFLPLAYDEVTPGPRNAEAVLAIARWLHPTSFGLPADGS